MSPGFLRLQEVPVGGDLLLQPGLDVQQHPVVLALLLDAGAHVAQLLLQHVDLVLVAVQHGAVASLGLSQGVVNRCFLRGGRRDGGGVSR